MAKPEEFARAVGPRIMTHGNFDHAETRPFKLLGHFDANHAASGFERNGIKNLPAEQAEVAIDIPDRKLKRPAHRAPIDFTDKDAIPRVGALDLVSIDEVDIGSKALDEVVH